MIHAGNSEDITTGLDITLKRLAAYILPLPPNGVKAVELRSCQSDLIDIRRRIVRQVNG